MGASEYGEEAKFVQFDIWLVFRMYSCSAMSIVKARENEVNNVTFLSVLLHSKRLHICDDVNALS